MSALNRLIVPDIPQKLHVINRASNYRQLFVDELLRLFYRSQFPLPSTYIDVIFHPNHREIKEVQSQQLVGIVPAGSIEHRNAVLGAFRITFRTGPLSFRVGHAPGHLLTWKPMDLPTTQIWPLPATDVHLRRTDPTPDFHEFDLDLIGLVSR